MTDDLQIEDDDLDDEEMDDEWEDGESQERYPWLYGEERDDDERESRPLSASICRIWRSCGTTICSWRGRPMLI